MQTDSEFLKELRKKHRLSQQDLADMNMNGLQRIAELIGIELGE